MDNQAALPYRSIWTDLMRTSFRQGFIKAGGLNTRYVQAGNPEAPAVVFLHGTGGSWEAFSANIGPHAEHFNVYAFDMVGSGFTDKPDTPYEIPVYTKHVVDFMKAVGLKKASFVGVSLGSFVATAMAVKHSEMVEKLCLISVSGSHADNTNMSRIRGTRTKAVDDPSWENIKGVFTNLIQDERKRIPDLIAVRQAVYRLPEAKMAMQHILALQDPDIRPRNLIPDEEWKKIKAPTLLPACVDHPDVYLDAAYKVSKLLPNAKLVEMKGCAHWPQFEEPEVFNRLHLDFLLNRR